MLFTVFVVSSVHPQSPATAKLNSEGATYVGWYGLVTPYTIVITIIKEAKAEIMTKNLFNYGVPSYLYNTLYAYKTP
jgi:hypothetical protein